MAFYGNTMQIIQIGAPSQLTTSMQVKFEECMSRFELHGTISWEERIARAQALFREVFILADEIIGCNQAILD